jgi:hypothetical protein
MLAVYLMDDVVMRKVIRKAPLGEKGFSLTQEKLTPKASLERGTYDVIGR